MLTLISNYEIDFWWWIHILHFKNVWNLPTLSLAWFFFFQIEFRTMCLLSDDQPFVLNISRTHHCGTKRHGTNLTHLTHFQPMLLLSSRQSQYNFGVIRLFLTRTLKAFSSSKHLLDWSHTQKTPNFSILPRRALQLKGAHWFPRIAFVKNPK